MQKRNNGLRNKNIIITNDIYPCFSSILSNCNFFVTSKIYFLVLFYINLQKSHNNEKVNYCIHSFAYGILYKNTGINVYIRSKNDIINI